jgi:transposase
MIAHVRSILKSFGIRVPSCSAGSFGAKVLEDIPRDLSPVLKPVVRQITALTKSIRSYDKYLQKLSEKRYPATERLRQVTGVGSLTALAFILTIEDPSRFKRSRDVGPFFGLCPRSNRSCLQNPQLRITKEGNGYMRRLLVNGAQYILGPFGPPCYLREWGLKVAERGGKNAKKRAVVAVARRLAVLLHRLWVTGEEYEPLRHVKQEKQEEIEPAA